MAAADPFELKRRIGKITTALESTTTMEGNLESAEDLPKVFKAVYKSVPLVLGFFKGIGEHFRESSLDEEAYQGIEGLLDNVIQMTVRLDEIYYAVVRNGTTPRQRRYSTAAERDGRVEELMKNILRNAIQLAGKPGFGWLGEEKVQELQEALNEVSEIPPSLDLDGQSLNTNNNYGSGSFNINNGSGPQNNNTSTGTQFNGAVTNAYSSAPPRLRQPPRGSKKGPQ